MKMRKQRFEKRQIHNRTWQRERDSNQPGEKAASEKAERAQAKAEKALVAKTKQLGKLKAKLRKYESDDESGDELGL